MEPDFSKSSREKALSAINKARNEYYENFFATSKKQANHERKLLESKDWVLDPLEQHEIKLTCLGVLKALK